MTKLEKAADNYTEKAENILRYSDGWEEYSDWEYVKKAYIKGAEWAINKACEWLKFNYTEYLNNTRVGIDIDEMVKDFKIDMNGE